MTKTEGLMEKVYRDKIIEAVESLTGCNFDDFNINERIDLMAYVNKSVLTEWNKNYSLYK